MATVAALGGVKVPGLLVRTDDWNAIVNEVVRLDADKADESALEVVRQEILTELRPAIGAVQASVTSLNALVAALSARVTALESLRDQYYQVTLSSPRINYLVGASAEIVINVSGLDGSPRSFPNAAQRPWVDVVASWGILSAAPGFTASAGAEGRSLAVRVDQNGVARVRLRAEGAFRLAAPQEIAMQQIFARNANSSETVEAVMLGSNTASEARSRGAFNVIEQEYDAGNAGVVQYIDQLYTGAAIGQKLDTIITTLSEFEDTRVTLLAFVKANNDPTSPDPARGSASTQITFRDWIRPFVDPPVLTLPVPLPRHWDPILPFLDRDPPLELVPDRLVRFLGGVFDGRGEAGRRRKANETLKLLELVNAPSAAGQVAITQAASVVTLALATSRGAPIAAGGAYGMLGIASQAEERSGRLARDIAQTGQRTQVFEGRVTNMERDVSTLHGQFQATVAEGGALTTTVQQVGELRSRLDGFDGDRIKPSEVRILDMNNSVLQLFERISRLEDR